MTSETQRTYRIWRHWLALVAVVALLACAAGGHQAQYRCPMHPEVVSDRPGDCPVCGMKLVASAPAAPGSGGATKPARYVCPMDPEVTSPEPGECPKCGMKLVLATDPPERRGAAGLPDGVAPVTLSSAKRELVGMTVGEAGPHRFVRHIRAPARVVPDEGRLFRVTAPVAGWVDKVLVGGIGDTVRKGEPLAQLYNVDALSQLRRDLFALGRDDPTQPASVTNQVLSRRLDPSLLSSELLRKRALRWGLSDAQIRDYGESPGDLKDLVIFATSSGLVAEKSVIPGQSVQAGDQLFVVADLSHVWAEVDVLASDAPLLHAGMTFEVEATALPGRSFPGRLAAFAPFLDPQTRTQRVRVELENPGLVLRPGLPAVATVAIDLGERLAVSSSSVLRTGNTTYAFRLAEGDRIVPVSLRLGISDGEFVEVLDGLTPGTRVITSATFLIDSESAMAAALRAVAER